MTTPNSCRVCKQSFESDRELQEHQESAHSEQRGDKLPASEGLDGERHRERESIS